MSSWPVFGFVTIHDRPLADGVAHEDAWLAAAAASGRSSAHLWQGPPGLVVPRRYALSPRWADVTARRADVHVRRSGGGLVPQGPGVWNLSLAWPAPQASPVDTEAVYRAFVDHLAQGLSRLGITARPQEVAGSFCDGRYNLAVDGRKLVGTAQAWRRVDGRPMVLAHAVVVVDADPQALTAQANTLEAELGNPQRYEAASLTSVAAAWCVAHGAAAPPADLAEHCRQALGQAFARVLPPHAISD